MLVCLCHPTTDRDVQNAIDDGARSVDEIGERCGAGTGCGSCRRYLGEQLARAGCAASADHADPVVPLVARTRRAQ